MTHQTKTLCGFSMFQCVKGHIWCDIHCHPRIKECQKNAKKPNHHYFSKKYRNTPPICIARRLQFILQCFQCPCTLRKAKHFWYSSHLYRGTPHNLYCNTPPICIKVLLGKSWWLWSPGCSPEQMEVHWIAQFNGYLSKKAFVLQYLELPRVVRALQKRLRRGPKEGAGQTPFRPHLLHPRSQQRFGGLERGILDQGRFWFLAERIFRGFLFLGRQMFLRILSPDFLILWEKVPRKILHENPKNNKNPRHISAEGPGHRFITKTPSCPRLPPQTPPPPFHPQLIKTRSFQTQGLAITIHEFTVLTCGWQYAHLWKDQLLKITYRNQITMYVKTTNFVRNASKMRLFPRDFQCWGCKIHPEVPKNSSQGMTLTTIS